MARKPYRKPAPRRKPPVRKPPPRKPPRRPPTRPPRRPPVRPVEPVTPETQWTPPAQAPQEQAQEQSSGFPRQIYNPGSRGQDARYDVRGLPRNERGNHVDSYGNEYDSNGLFIGGPNPPPTFTHGLKPADQMDGDQWGDYLGAGGGGGGGASGAGGMGYSSIPGAGTYLFEQAMAQGAYDRAIAELKTQRRQRQVAAGLRDDWTVDPSVMYGGYQQMLRGQGLELNAAEEQAQERGLMGAGLGRQAETTARYGHTVQNLGFKNQLSEWENEYQRGIAEAEFAKQQAMLDALMGGYGNAYGDWGEAANDQQSGLPGGDYYKQFFRGPARRQPPLRRRAAGFGGAQGYAQIRRRQQQRAVPQRKPPPRRRGY